MKIAFIGLGKMGLPMALRLAKAGHELVVWNRTSERAAAVVELGAAQAASPAEAASGAEAVVSVVFDDVALEQVTFGAQGLLAALEPEAIHLSCSTVSVSLADRLAQAHAAAGRRLVSAPLFGSSGMAQEGSLYFAAAGPEEAFAALRPVFDCLGQHSFYLGPQPRRANVAKLANNFLIFALTQSIGEALALSEKSGLPRERMMELLWESDFGRRIFAVYGRKVLERSFTPATAPTDLALKDIGLVLDAASRASVAMPTAGLAHDQLTAAIGRGYGDLDFAALSLVIDEDSGISRG